MQAWLDIQLCLHAKWIWSMSVLFVQKSWDAAWNCTIQSLHILNWIQYKGNIWFILVWLDTMALRKERLLGTDKFQICFPFWNLPHSYSAGTDRTLNTHKQNQPTFMIWCIIFVAIITWNCLMRIFILKWQFSFSYISWGKKYITWFYSASLYIVSVLFSIDIQTYFIYTSCSIPACLESVSCMECSYESMPLSVMEQPKPNLQLVLKIWLDKNKCKPVRKLTYL